MGRENHLVSLMYFAQQYEWSAPHLESRALYGHPLQETRRLRPLQRLFYIVAITSEDNALTLKITSVFIRGERKWLRHICASCWTRLRKQEPLLGCGSSAYARDFFLQDFSPKRR